MNQARRNGPPNRKGRLSFIRKLIKNWAPILAILMVIFVMAGVGVFAWLSRDLPDPDKIIDRAIAQSTKIYARDETTLLYEIHGDEKRTLVNLEDIPDYAKWATITLEDKNFYSHSGYSLTGIAKSACHEAFGNLGGLCPRRGGSTITQQFVKNSILTSERSYSRKVKELVLAYQIEKKFTKDQILKLYLNEIPYGSTSYGIESAAQTFFGVSSKDLSLDEAALLASLPQLPSYYSPYGSNTEELIARQKTAINLMVAEGYITAEEGAAAKKIDVLAKIQPKRENITAPHFVFYVRDQLANKYGEKVVEQGGLKVITTLNIDKQRIAEEVITEQAKINAERYGASNAALISLDTKTGQILAMVGSKDYFDEDIDGNVNVVLRPRQPGSSFKPIVYATAFSRGYTPETTIFDLVTNFKTDTQDYEPKNYDLSERGPVSMRKALAGSLNIPAVKTLYLAGIDNVLNMAQALGYTTLGDRSRFGLSLVLGGGEVTLLEHTSAFATMAREGERHPVTGILRVEDSRGKVLEKYEDRAEQVFDKDTARLLNNILSDDSARAYVFGAGSRLTIPGRPVAAKTGTTNDYRDAWTLGYTPSFATGVWVGNNDNSEMKRGAAGSVVAAPIWQEFMKRTVGGPVEPFKSPAPNDSAKLILQGGVEGGAIIKVDVVTQKRIPSSCADTYPAAYIEEKTFSVAHNILHYIDKDDPEGAEPADPTIDPQYERWEEPVRRWAEDKEFLETLPPEEECDLRAKENRPIIKFTSPKNGDTVSNGTLYAKVSITSTRSITKVVYYLDDEEIATITKAPYALEYDLDKIKVGFHDLTAEAYDNVRNITPETISINYLIPSASSNTNSTGT